MKRRIVDALIITAAIALSIPISPAKAQLIGGFNPAGSVPGLGLPDLGGGSDLGVSSEIQADCSAEIPVRAAFLAELMAVISGVDY